MERWPDDRIDDLARRVGNVEPVVTKVAVLTRDMESLTQAVRENTTVTKDLSRQLEDVKTEPINRIRRRWEGLIVAVAGALVGGGIAVLAAVIASGH